MDYAKPIILTGKIGSGKTFISNQLYDHRSMFSRSITHQVNLDHEAFFYIYGEGKQYLINNFLTLDKRVISSILFSNPLILADFNAHYAPALREMFFYSAREGAIVEAPLLFQMFRTEEERIWLKRNVITVAVVAEDYHRYERAAFRDKKTINQIMSVDRAQLDQKQISSLSDVTFDNSEFSPELFANLIKRLNEYL